MSLFKTNVEQQFGVSTLSSQKMEAEQNKWIQIIKNNPAWLDAEDGINTINFAKFLCQYTAKKACLNVKVTIEGSERADYINSCIREMYSKSLQYKVEDMLGVGGIMLKPNGIYKPSGAIDYIMPWNYIITEKNSNGDILGAIFLARLVKDTTHYTRLEYHHFITYNTEDSDVAAVQNAYVIENKAFKSENEDSLGTSIPLTDVEEWAHIAPKLIANNIEKPLFAYMKTPLNNTVDYASPEGIALFANAIKELEDLDIAWSRKSNESYDSKNITFMDETALMKTNPSKKGLRERIKLPAFVKGISMGIDKTKSIEEHVPTMNTENRIKDINSILSMISTKCGFSQGQFVLDRKTGRVTAKEIESDDNETVETITTIRNSIENAIKDLCYALNKYCDLFYEMPDGYVNILDEEVDDDDIFYFKDLMSTFEQDRDRAYQLMIQKIISKKKYLMDYEGYSEEEALQIIEEAAGENQNTQQNGLFDEE